MHTVVEQARNVWHAKEKVIFYRSLTSGDLRSLFLKGKIRANGQQDFESVLLLYLY